MTRVLGSGKELVGKGGRSEGRGRGGRNWKNERNLIHHRRKRKLKISFGCLLGSVASFIVLTCEFSLNFE